MRAPSATKPSFVAVAASVLVYMLGIAQAAQMKVGAFTGAVTLEELDSFNVYMAAQEPANSNIGNAWSQGSSGELTKAAGLIYLINNNQTTLDQMIRFCDAVLSERNDIAPAPVGQNLIWTGKIDAVWPNENTSVPVSTGGEQGDSVGHLANCAYLILKTQNLYNKQVTTGDPDGHGATYLDRAKTFLQAADYSMTEHILARLLNLTADNRMYFANDSLYKPGDAVPWNQQMMFNYAFQNLCSAHRILGDNSTLIARYKSIMVASLDWFFNGGGATTVKDTKGTDAYVWDYAPDTTDVEDSNHGSLDVAGFARAYITNDYNISAVEMTTLANMFVDVMTVGPPTNYAGRVNGQTGPCADATSTCHARNTSTVRSGYLFLSEFRPDAYESMLSADFKENGTTSSPDGFSRFLWVKNRLNSGLLTVRGASTRG